MSGFTSDKSDAVTRNGIPLLDIPLRTMCTNGFPTEKVIGTEERTMLSLQPSIFPCTRVVDVTLNRSWSPLCCASPKPVPTAFICVPGGPAGDSSGVSSCIPFATTAHNPGVVVAVYRNNPSLNTVPASST